MSLDGDQLFALLPAVYRRRDEESGGPLQALFAVLAAQSELVEANIEQLYDDQFIETCAPWVIPYIGDLVGYNSVYEATSTGSEPRAEVANTIAYRRRKGTLLALEQMAADVSGRPAVAVEEFKRLVTTESMRDVRPRHRATVDLRNRRALDRLGSAFETENHTIDVRRIAPRLREAAKPDSAPLEIALHGPGRFNIPDVAIHLWRCQSWQVHEAPAFAIDARRFMFSPLGANMPLISAVFERVAFSSLATRADVPEPIARDEVMDVYGSASLLLIGDAGPVDPGLIYPANLEDRVGGSWCTVPAGMIAVDPALGRIQYADDLTPPQSLRLDYCYGFPGPIGGGPYDRSAALAALDLAGADFYAVVGDPATPKLESAVAAWNAIAPGASGVIVLPGFAALTSDLTGGAAVSLPAGSSLSIVSGSPDPTGGPRDVIFSGCQATLTGDIEVVGQPGATAGELVLSGVWIAGRLLIDGAPSTIRIVDSMLVPGLQLFTDGEPVWPGEPSVTLTAAGSDLILQRAISGPLAVDRDASVRVCASIVDAGSPSAVAYAAPNLADAGGDLQVTDSTLIGKVRTRTFTLASNTIFHARLADGDPWDAAVWASRKQAGCVRFCSLPFDSITPRRYNCLPPDAASEAALQPAFVTLRYGDPAYALLSGDCPLAIWKGAANGSQLGAYLQIQETEAVTNVQLRAPEYLPALMESGVYLHPSRQRPEPTPTAPPYGYGGPLPGEEPALPGIGAALI